jgi:hypothetical protein
MEQIQTYINYAILVLTVLPVVISVVRYLGTITKSKALIAIADQATNIVLAIEQTGITGSVAKKQNAARQLEAVAKSLGISLSADEISTMIEKSVYEMNQNKPEKPATEEETVRMVSLFDEVTPDGEA